MRIKDRTIVNIIRKVATKYGLTNREVEDIYSTYFKTIKSLIVVNKVKGVTDQEVDDVKSNFNLPGFGKLYMNKNKAKIINNKLKDKDDTI